MQTMIIAFVAFLVIFSLMAVGYIFQRRRIQGSCSGISAVGVEKVCGCAEPCDRRKKAMKELEEKKGITNS